MKPKKRKRVFPQGYLYKILNTFLFLLLLVNVFVIYRFERDRRPQVIHSVETITTNSVLIVTNYISSADHKVNVDTNLLDRLLVPSRTVSMPYRYMIWNQHCYISLYGQTLTIGSPTSYGRIVEIYPERVLLDTSVWITNTTPDPPVSRDSPSYVRRDRTLTERRDYESVSN